MKDCMMVNNIDKNIADKLNVGVIEKDVDNVLSLIKSEKNEIREGLKEVFDLQDLEEQFVLAKNLLNKISNKGYLAINNAFEYAEQSGDSEYFMAMSHLIKSINETIKTVFDIKEKVLAMQDRIDPESTIETQINQINFFGTTNEIIEQIRQRAGTRAIDAAQVIDGDFEEAGE